MTREDVHQVFEAILPQEAIEHLCTQYGVVERQRKLHLGMLVRAMVIMVGTPGGAYQADVLRSYLELEVPKVARSAFYRWFDEPFERFMAALSERTLTYARAQQVYLSGMLGEVKDWYIVDSITLKVHKVLSVGCGAPVHYHFSPAREHDSGHLTIDESLQGCGLLADLAYASLARLRACHEHGVRFVIRLEGNWKPKVTYIARGHVTQAFCPGTDVDALLDQDILVLDGRVIDADVVVGGDKHPLRLRLVRVDTPKGYGFFLSNLPPRIGPRQVADFYRVRSEVELNIRLDKSVHRLDQINAERPYSAKTLLHASLIGSIIAAFPAHTHNLQTCPPQEGTPRTEVLLHPRRLALQLAVSCQAIAQAFDLKGAAAKRRWQQIAELFTHTGKDPNWRRRPSVLSAPRLETTTRCEGKNHSTQSEGGSLSGHLWLSIICRIQRWRCSRSAGSIRKLRPCF